MANFFATNNDVTSYLSKQDVARMDKGEANSNFLRLRVHIDNNHKDEVLVRRPDMVTGKPTLQWVLPDTTTADDSVVLKIETITYTRNAPMGATAIDGVNRWFESVDTAFVAVRRVQPEGATLDGTLLPRETVIDTFMRYDRVNKNFVTGSVVPLRFCETDEDLACYAAEFLARLDKNTVAIDHRKADWTQVTVVEGKKVKTDIVTHYGMFLLQRERDNAARKNAKV